MARARLSGGGLSSVIDPSMSCLLKTRSVQKDQSETKRNRPVGRVADFDAAEDIDVPLQENQHALFAAAPAPPTVSLERAPPARAPPQPAHARLPPPRPRPPPPLPAGRGGERGAARRGAPPPRRLPPVRGRHPGGLGAGAQAGATRRDERRATAPGETRRRCRAMSGSSAPWRRRSSRRRTPAPPWKRSWPAWRRSREA